MRRFVPLLFCLILAGASLTHAATKNTHGGTNYLDELGFWEADLHVPLVASGCQPTLPVSTLTLAQFPCEAYVMDAAGKLIYVEQSAAAVGPFNEGNGTYYLAIHVDNRDSTTPSGWHRQPQTAYLWKKADTEPAQPASGFIFYQVVVSGGVITSVFDRARPGTGWVEGRTFGVRTDNPKTPQLMFVNTAPPATGPAPGVWHQFSVINYGIPSDATSVEIGGILVITHGTEVGICNVVLAARAGGDTLTPGNYIFQGQAVEVTDGARADGFARVPVRNGVFELQWNGYRGAGFTPETLTYPSGCAFGVNLSIQGYTRTSLPSASATAPLTPVSPLTGILNVENYGAVHNGVADDTAEIQAALDAVNGSVGGTVWFPPGVYCLSDTLRIKRNGTHLLGAGAGSAILRTCTNWTSPPITGTGVFAAQVSLLHSDITNGPTGNTHLTDITIEGFSFEGMASATASSPKCITGLYADNVTIINNKFVGSPYECIMPSGLYPGSDWKISGNHFLSTGQSAVVNHQNGTAIEFNVLSGVVSGNTFTSVASGIGASTTYGRVAITGNTITDPTLAGITLGGTIADTGFLASVAGTDDIVVAGNTVMVQAVTTHIRRGIVVQENVRNVNISNNVVKVFAVASGEEVFGIALLGPYQGCQVNNNEILMDAISANLAASKKFLGIYGAGGATSHLLKCAISDNTIRIFNNTTNINYGGIFAIAGSGETYDIRASDNKIYGFDPANTQYGIRLSKTAGALTHVALSNIADGRHEYNGTAYCAAGCTHPLTDLSTGSPQYHSGFSLKCNTLAVLGTPQDGTIQCCSDCQVTSGASNVCATGGSGALAFRVGGAWRCFTSQN